MVNIQSNFVFSTGINKYKQVFQLLKPAINERMIKVLQMRTLKGVGRPITTDFNKFLDAVYYMLDSGAQVSYMVEKYHISKGTYYRYLHVLEKNHIIEDLYSEVIDNYQLKNHETEQQLIQNMRQIYTETNGQISVHNEEQLLVQNIESISADVQSDEPTNLIIDQLSELTPDKYWITDGSIVKSMNGSQSTGRNPTDRGRKGIKFLLICDGNRITKKIVLGPANISDSTMLSTLIERLPPQKKMIKCLADAGFVGRDLKRLCLEKNVDLIARPKKKRNGEMTHTLSTDDKLLLKSKRNRIELLNGQIKRFRSLMIKWTKTIATYQTYLLIAILCITCHQIMIRS